MVCYSTNPREGYLTKDGIREIKSELARQIFRQDLTHIYEQQTDRRNRLNTQSLETMRELCGQIKISSYDNPELERLLLLLSESLSKTGFRKVYAFLKPEQKVIVDQIVDELAKDSRVSACYDAWYDLREEVLRTYNDTLPPRAPLSEQKEFKTIKNMVITEAAGLAGLSFDGGNDIGFIPDEAQTLLAEPSAELPYDSFVPDFVPDDDEDIVYSADWSDTYKQARAFLFGVDDTEPDFTTARDLFLMEANEGNALAMHDLGRIYADGLGVDADAEVAQHWYAEALTAFLSVESGRPKPYTQYRIGKMYAAGLGAEQDYEQAAAWFEKAVQKNHKYAQYSLAGLYYNGHGIAQDFEQAFDLYKKSAEQGNAYASYELAKMLRDGIGTKLNTAEADRHFQSAFNGFVGMEAGGKDDKFQYRIGQMLRDGVGTDADVTKATGYFERSAKLGNPHAQYALAKMYLADENDNVKISQAVAWLEKSADSGNPFAQYALGKLYRDGNHVEKDIAKAVDLLTKSAEQDNEYAAYALGKLYLSGKDVQKDIPAAIDWLLKSTEQDNQFAQYQLGKLYLMGKDVPRDREQALHWLTLSAAQGNEFAQFFLDRFDQFQDPSMFAAATRLLQQLGKIFEEQQRQFDNKAMRIDRKRMRILQEKKMAQGHAHDDYEQTQNY